MEKDSFNGLRRTTVLIVSLFLVISCLFMIYPPRISSKLSILHATRPETTDFARSYSPKSYGINDPRDPRFYNIILEEEALLFEPCQDIKETSSIEQSDLSLIDRVNRTYNIGEEIRAIVTLSDGYGKRKHSGGDHLRATIESKAFKSSSPCVVADIRDGTQEVVCDALWSGTSTITVTLAYTREAITAHYRMRNQVGVHLLK